jgi:hypothetical protein
MPAQRQTCRSMRPAVIFKHVIQWDLQSNPNMSVNETCSQVQTCRSMRPAVKIKHVGQWNLQSNPNMSVNETCLPAQRHTCRSMRPAVKSVSSAHVNAAPARVLRVGMLPLHVKLYLSTPPKASQRSPPFFCPTRVFKTVQVPSCSNCAYQTVRTFMRIH